MDYPFHEDGYRDTCCLYICYSKEKSKCSSYTPDDELHHTKIVEQYESGIDEQQKRHNLVGKI